MPDSWVVFGCNNLSGSIPRGLGLTSGLSLLVLYSAPRGFSPATPVFPSLQKPSFDLIWFRFGRATGLSVLIYLFIYLFIINWTEYDCRYHSRPEVCLFTWLHSAQSYLYAQNIWRILKKVGGDQVYIVSENNSLVTVFDELAKEICRE